jgi:putative membrane protein
MFAPMKHRNSTRFPRLFAVLLACSGALIAADERSSQTVGGNTARDRNDTIRSNQTRVNTTGIDTDTSEVTKLNRGDRRFIETAAMNGHTELRIARMAAERSGDPRVRSYAQQIVRDHEKAHAELNQLAAKKNVSLADFEDRTERQFNRLSEKTGTDFDTEFLKHMRNAHEKDIEMYEKAARKAEDPDVAAFASKHLPVLQQHSSAVQELVTALKR